MRSAEQRRRPPLGRWYALCVLGLLAGLLGMHGLAPGGSLPQPVPRHPATGHAVTGQAVMGPAVMGPAVMERTVTGQAVMGPAVMGRTVAGHVGNGRTEAAGSATGAPSAAPAGPLGAGPSPAARAVTGGASAHPGAGAVPSGTLAHAGCVEDRGGCGGGHVHHADAMCSSGAPDDAPAPAPPAADPLPAPPGEAVVRARAAGAPDGARAPPSLAELQLLRI
ncbi:DUF6153 family protein [Streptomyces sp. SID8352]|uniref:DUF6153 family protein n=1 Tax=Streptomyces sp. SID8352 TaxID=2690338 RepID=UPI001925204A